MTHEFPKFRFEEKLALRVNEAAMVSGLSRTTIYKLLNAGKLPSTKVGGRRLILRSALETLLREGT